MGCQIWWDSVLVRPLSLLLTAAHLKSYRNKPGSPEVIEARREAPVKYLKGIKWCSSQKVLWLPAQLKSPYTNAHSMGTKQEQLKATVLLESYGLVALTETWWGEKLGDGSVIIHGYRLFRRDRQRKEGWGGCPLHQEL